MILDEIKKANVQAMKDKDQNARAIYGVVMTKAMLEQVKKREKQEELTDADMVAILQKAIKELNDECENYRKANNTAEVIKIEAQKELVEKLETKVCAFRHFGANTLELACVGTGQLDASILVKPLIWDIAAASLFIKEAGGRIATLSGKTSLKDLVEADFVLATNLTLFPKLQKEIK